MDSYCNRWFYKKELEFRQVLLKRFPSQYTYIACFDNINEIETKYIEAECVETAFGTLSKKKDSKGVLYCAIIDEFLKHREYNTNKLVIYDISKHKEIKVHKLNNGEIKETITIHAIARYHDHSNIFNGERNPFYWNQVNVESMESLRDQRERWIKVRAREYWYFMCNEEHENILNKKLNVQYISFGRVFALERWALI